MIIFILAVDKKWKAWKNWNQLKEFNKNWDTFYDKDSFQINIKGLSRF